MPTTIGLLLTLSFVASLCALGFLIWAIAKRQFSLTQSDASTIFEEGERGQPDDPTAFGHHAAGSNAHYYDAIRAGIDKVGKAPILLMVAAATFWLLLGSVFGVIASLKLHMPDWLTAYAPLTFGRVRTMHLNLVAYGWLSVAGIALALWIIPRIFHTPLRLPRLAYFGAVVWTVGVALGVTAIGSGWTQGVEWLEIPWQIGLLLALGGACMAIPLVVTAKHRQVHHIYVTGWYFLGAMLWFPILYVIANFPGLHSGVQQATVNWWFAHNVLGLWLTPLGVGTAYYVIPKVIGKPIYSYSVSLLGFWGLALFYSQVGMHHLIGGPVPTWVVTLSIVHSVMMFVPVIAVAINQHMTVAKNSWAFKQSMVLRFVSTGAIMYTLASLQGSIESLRSVNNVTHFTHYTVGHAHLGAYGFVSLVMFGAFYYMLPYVTGRDWPWPRLLKLHYWLVLGGFAVYFFGLSIGGLVQGMGLLEAGESFADITRSTLPYLEARSLGGILMTLGHFVFAFHIAALMLGKGATRPATMPAAAPLPTAVAAGV
ncbi:cbb3-type cytochrome c oxidase subunit I [Oxalobacteraceae bacterium R-40]|uniref:Cbb3-type cytochrome c oxidase subunit I n=1 Tax=Keguizhuia sedimenti TaxID=3064264 RepID=A0ABU1BTY4_9BURK|nr:cbb3-type cytochrome c oxidase subunit I [Oxalobacteraceae bacterium R-40]